MSKTSNKEYFWIIRGEYEDKPYIFYGINPPCIFNGRCVPASTNCEYFGAVFASPLKDMIEPGAPAKKLYMRLEKPNK